MKKYILILIVSFAIISEGEAQKPYWELGFGAGVSSYWGDLHSGSFSDNFKIMNPAGNLQMRYNYGNLSARAMLTVGQLRGSDEHATDEDKRMRNLSFVSPITEFSLIGEYNIFGFDPTDNESIFTPHVLLGVGVLRFNPKTEYNGQTVILQPLGTEGQGIDGFPAKYSFCLLYTSPSPRDATLSRMPSSA